MKEQVEIWKPVLNYEGFYEVSNFGQIRSLDRKSNSKAGSFKIVKGRILKPYLGRYGYYIVGLTDGHRHSKTWAIHIVVATNFINNPQKLPQINHIDSNKLNNTIDNLEWVSNRENISHMYTHKGNTVSKYIGVSYETNIQYRGSKRWVAGVSFQGKRIRIGRFYTEIDAANAYMNFLKENNIINRYLVAI